MPKKTVSDLLSKSEPNLNNKTNTESSNNINYNREKGRQQRYRQQKQRSPGQEEFIEKRRIKLQMLKAQRQKNPLFKNARKSFQRRFRQYVPNNLNKKVNNNSMSPQAGNSQEPIINDCIDNEEILEIEKELVAETERIKLLRLQAEANLKREENATRINESNSRQITIRRSRSRDFRRKSNVHSVRKNEQRRIISRDNQQQGLGRSMKSSRDRRDLSPLKKQNQYTRTPDIYKANNRFDDQLIDKSPIFEETTPDSFQDRGYFEYKNNKSPLNNGSLQNQSLIHLYVNNAQNPLSHCLDLDRDNTDDFMQEIKTDYPSSTCTSNRLMDKHVINVTKETNLIDGNHNRRLIHSTPDEHSVSIKFLNNDQLEKKLLPLTPALGGGMFDKHIQRIQNEFDDRFARRQPSMEVDNNLSQTKHKQKYIDKTERNYIKSLRIDDTDIDDQREHDVDNFVTSRNNRTEITTSRYSDDNRYTSRRQHNEERFKNDTTDWEDQELNLQQINSNKQLFHDQQYNHYPSDDRSRFRQNPYQRDNKQTTIDRSKSRDLDYNTFSTNSNLREYIDRAITTNRNSDTTEFQRENQKSNSFPSNESDNPFTNSTNDRSSDYHYYAGRSNVGDSRSVAIVRRKSSTASKISTQQAINTGKKLQISDYRSPHRRENILDAEEPSTFIQRSQHNQYSSSNNKKMNDGIVDARQYIIEKEMQKFNELSRRSDVNFHHNERKLSFEKKLMPSDWTDRNLVSQDELQTFSTFNDEKLSPKQWTKFQRTSNDDEYVAKKSSLNSSRYDRGDNNRSPPTKLNQHRYDQSTEQSYNKKQSAIESGNNRFLVHGRNHKKNAPNFRYDANERLSLIREKSKTHAIVNATKYNNDDRQQHFSMQSRNGRLGVANRCNRQTTDNNRMDSVYQRKNSYLSRKH